MGNLASYGRPLLSLTSYEHGMSRLASPGLGFPFLSDELSVCPHAPLSHPHFGLENGSCPVRAGGSGTRRSKPSVGWSSGFLCLLVCFLRSPQAPPPPPPTALFSQVFSWREVLTELSPHIALLKTHGGKRRQGEHGEMKCAPCFPSSARSCCDTSHPAKTHSSEK